MSKSYPNDRPEPIKKRQGCLIPILALIAIAVIIAMAGSDFFSKIGTPERHVVIEDAAKIAGISLEELKSLHPRLEEDGPVEVVKNDGSIVEGVMYSLTGGLTNYVLVDDKVISFQYWANNPIKYKTEADIFTMFGIQLGEDARIEVDTGSALRITNVSEQVCEVWIQSMDSQKQEFDVVSIRFDSRYS